MSMMFRMRPAVIVLSVVFMAMADAAFAQGGATFGGVVKNVAGNVDRSVPGIAMLSYVIGVFFAASGLLKLKDWINEGDKVGILPALMRLSASALLILLPHMMVISTGTIFGSDKVQGIEVKVHAPRLGAFEKTGR